MSKVTPMYDRSDNPRTWTVEQMLEESLAEVRAGTLKPDTAIILFHTKSSGLDYKNVGMSMEEVLSVLQQVQYLHMKDKWGPP